MPQFADLMETFHTAQAGERGQSLNIVSCELGRVMPRLRLVLAK